MSCSGRALAGSSELGGVIGLPCLLILLGSVFMVFNYVFVFVDKFGCCAYGK